MSLFADSRFNRCRISRNLLYILRRDKAILIFRSKIAVTQPFIDELEKKKQSIRRIFGISSNF